MKGFVIEKEWKENLGDFLQKDSFQKLIAFIGNEYLSLEIFPQSKDIFRALSLTPFSKVKVVILGQDPYHNDGQAEGLCFSVPRGVAIPPSLKNIYKEIESDYMSEGVTKDFTNGSLENWGRNGVLLLNAILTVEAHTPASHKGKGWEEFTDVIIKTISDKHEHVVFMLWGNYARSKKTLIKGGRHLILEASHPSPFSAHSGFFGCRHFSKCNEYLIKHGKKPIQW